MTSHLWDQIAEEEREIVAPFLEDTPVRVGELARALGIEVVRSPLPPKISGSIQPFDEEASRFVIKVNKYESVERQRFTIAHEIAHYLLHRKHIGAGVIDSIMYRSTLTSRKEVEANQLAADIIMPRKHVTKAYKELRAAGENDLVEELASTFRVSVPAMEVRLGVA